MRQAAKATPGTPRPVDGWRGRHRLAILGLLLLAGCAREPESPPLPALGIDLDATTVSGFAAGGYMAVQYQVAYAGEVRGAGVFAAGPWGCARGRLQLALQDCAERADAAPPLPWLLQRLRLAAAAGEIAPTARLADDRVWIFRGERDDRLAPQVTAALVGFYRAVLPATSVTLAQPLPAGHAMPTESAGGDCASSAPPHLAACRHDSVGEMFAVITGREPQPTTEPGELQRFGQRRYAVRGAPPGTTGFVYVPAACRVAGSHCPLHIAFHGCEQGVDAVGETFVREAGYRRAADRHGIVVLFPQVGRSWLQPFNPGGCWDWWGYTGKDYLARGGVQLAAVHAMAEALALTPAR